MNKQTNNNKNNVDHLNETAFKETKYNENGSD